MADGNGTGRILSLDQVASARNAKDDQGRLLRHNATIKDAHDIAIEEGNKVHAFYMNQIPPFVARMIQDALVSYGLIQVQQAPGAEGQPVVGQTPEPPGSPPNAVAAADQADDGGNG